jgi:hypothetical protein
MKTSRLITATVTQNGTGRCDGKGLGKTEGIVNTTNAVTSISLSAIGSRIVPSCDFWVETASQQAVETVSYAGQHKHAEGKDELLIEEQRDEDRDQHHPKHSQQVRDGNNPR